MKILHIIPLLLITGCITTVQSAHGEYHARLATCKSMSNQGLLSEQQYLKCFEPEYVRWYQESDADMSSVYKLINDNMSVAKKVDEGRLKLDKAQDKYTENMRAYYARDREYRDNQRQIASQQEIQDRVTALQHQEYLDLKNELINKCMEEYEDSLPVEYKTSCYGNTCTTTPHKIDNNWNIHEQCAFRVKKYLTANGIVSPYGF